MPAKQETRTVKIVVDARQADKATKMLNREFKKLNRSATSVTQSVMHFQQGLHSLIAFLGLREVAQLSDEYTNLNSRLKLVLGNTESFSQVHKDLLSTANETATTVGKLGKAYVDLRLKVRDVKMTHEDTLTVVRAMAQSFRISGSTAKEASGATLQLMQALASGRLQGDELRALRENNILLLHVIEDEYRRVKGIAQDVKLDIKELGASGALTPVIILNALKRAAPQFEAQAAKIDKTFSLIFNKARNNIIAFFGAAENSGRLKPLKDALNTLAGSIDTLVFGFGTFVSVFLGARMLGGLRRLTDAFVVLNAAVAANKFFVIATAVSLLVMGIYELTKGTTEINGKLVNTRDLLGNIILNILKDLWELVKNIVGSVLQGIKDILTSMNPFSSKMIYMVKFFMDLPFRGIQIWRSFFSMIGFLIKEVVSSINNILLPALEGVMDVARGDKLLGLSKIGKAVLNLGAANLGEDSFSNRFDAKLDEEYKKIWKAGASDVFNPIFGAIADFGPKIIEGINEAIRGNFGPLKAAFDNWWESILKRSSSGLKDLTKKTSETTNTVGEDIKEKTNTFTGYIREGIQKYVSSIQDYGKQVADFGTKTFKSLEDTLVQFVQTGKLEIKSLTDSILADFARLQIRKNITLPLAQAFGDALGGGGTSNTNTSLGSFSLGSGRAGDQGYFPAYRAAPEASGLPVIPGFGAAPRGSVGKVVVNNNSGTAARVEERTGSSGEREITVTIDKRIDDYFHSGRGDKALNTNFGLRRVGVR